MTAALPWTRPRIWTILPGAVYPHTECTGNYLVCTTAGIGDALMAVPLLRVLKEARPQSRTTVLANPVNAALLKNQPAVDDIVVFPHQPTAVRLIALAWRLRRRHFVAAFGAIPSDLLSLSLLLKLSGVPRRIKQRLTAGQGIQGLESWFTDLLESGPEKHKVFANLDLLIPIGISPAEIPRQRAIEMLALAIPADELQGTLARFPRSPLRPLRIGMHAGCKKGWEFKRWDPDRFAALADQMIEKRKAEVFWFGDASEEELVRSIMLRMREPSTSVAGVLGIHEAAALISTCNLFVSNDSGPMHLATAVGVRTIALYNSDNARANPARTGPLGDSHVILKKPNLQDITVAEVAEAALHLSTAAKDSPG